MTADPSRRPRTSRSTRDLCGFVVIATFVVFAVPAGHSVPAQADISDTDLIAASGGRVVRVGALSDNGQATMVPLELYVARVLAGEAEPRAADGAYEALAVAIRTFALANAGRHSRDGFDLCDTTHCQVPRGSTAVTRRAAFATAGQVLTYQGRAADVFYSASCGGRSESAADMWPGSNYPYLQTVRDDVHEEEPWTLELSLADIQRALERAGFEGQRLRDIRIDGRTESGRASRLRLAGMQPDLIGGDQFRAAIGYNVLRSTAFSIDRRGDGVRFTGRGFGHGVGLCVIGAGRRAARREDVRTILAHYFPGLTLARLDTLTSVSPTSPATAEAPAAAPAPAPPARPVLVRVPLGSPVTADEIARLAATTHDDLSKLLGTSVAPFTIQLHDSLESFRLATGKPWWVSAFAEGTTIELAPASLLAQREGVEAVVRIAIGELLVGKVLEDRPEWVLVGAGRYFARRLSAAPAIQVPRNLRCPADAELNLAISVTAQRDAEARAEACFARGLSTATDWRLVGR